MSQVCVRGLGVKTAAARRKVSMHMQVGRNLTGPLQVCTPGDLCSVKISETGIWMQGIEQSGSDRFVGRCVSARLETQSFRSQSWVNGTLRAPSIFAREAYIDSRSEKGVDGDPRVLHCRVAS